MYFTLKVQLRLPFWDLKLSPTLRAQKLHVTGDYHIERCHSKFIAPGFWNLRCPGLTNLSSRHLQIAVAVCLRKCVCVRGLPLWTFMLCLRAVGQGQQPWQTSQMPREKGTVFENPRGHPIGTSLQTDLLLQIPHHCPQSCQCWQAAVPDLHRGQCLLVEGPHSILLIYVLKF